MLGAVRVWRQEHELTLGHPRHRALMAMLAVRASRPVGRDELIDGIWGSDPPATAANCVHSYVARLRLVLEPGRAARAPSSVLASAGPGYALRLDAGQVDEIVSEGHLVRARRWGVAGDPAGLVLSLDAALALWHGTPLAGIRGPFAEVERARLFEEYLTAAEVRAELMLATGGQEQLAGHRAQLVRAHPFRERMAALYMLALFRGGRPAEALAAYQRTRRVLVDELGVEPGLELQRVRDDILHNRDTDMTGGPGSMAHGQLAPVTPHQLPPAIPHFTGPPSELESLAGLAAKARGAAGWAGISVINGTPGRGQLFGLAAADGAHQLALPLFSGREGRELLARRLGHERVAAEPGAASELGALCAQLPLALSVVAARAAALPTVPLAALAGDLRETRARLDALDTGDGASSIRAAFARSYQDLSSSTARMFRLVGLHPGPDISVPAAASMAGFQADQARAALAELARFHLATEHAHGRFSCHDLLRAYAAEQAARFDTELDRRAALHRMLDHYLHTARRGAVLLHPARDEVTPAPPLTGAIPERLTDHRQALAWYDVEHQVLLASADLAAGARFDIHAWQLPWALVPFLYRRGDWPEWVTLQTPPLPAAERLDDHPARARVLLDLGYAHAVRADASEASRPLRQALRLFRQLGDQVGEARTYNPLAMVLEIQHRHADALRYAERSLNLYEAAGNPAAQANALTTVGWYHALLGDHQQALTCSRRAIIVLRELGNCHGEAGACLVAGHALHHLGRPLEAITCHERPLMLYRELGDLQHQADALIQLGDAQHAAGNLRAAHEAWQRSVTILEH